MRSVYAVVLVAGLLVPLSSVSWASYFEENFDAYSPVPSALNSADWLVRQTTSTESTVAADTETGLTPPANQVAAFDFTGSASVQDTSRAWTQGSWGLDTYGTLVWTIDFRVAAGTADTVVIPFVYDLDRDDEGAAGQKYYKDTDVNVVIVYDDTAGAGVANLSVFSVTGQDSFEDSGGTLWRPQISDTTWYRLEMVLDDTANTASGTIWDPSLATPTLYTAEIANLDGLINTSLAGHFGMQVYNQNAVGSNAKTVEFDQVRLTPEPAALALVGMGIAALLRRRR